MHFLKSLKHFFVRPGHPKKTYSVQKRLQKVFKDERFLVPQLVPHLSKVPHPGYLFEQIVRIVKKSLYKATGKTILMNQVGRSLIRFSSCTKQQVTEQR